MDTCSHPVRRVTHREFSQALQRASYGVGAGLSFKYDARHDQTVWTTDGRPVGLTVGRIGATTACYLATHADYPASRADLAGQLVAHDAEGHGRKA